MNQYGAEVDPNSKCKMKHVGIGIGLGVIVALAITIPLALVWYKVSDFDDFDADDRFFLCQPASKAVIPQKGGECVSINFNTN